MNRALDRVLAASVVLLVAADWLSKFWITNRMALGESHSLVDGWLYFVHRQNPGVAFSMFDNLPTLLRAPLLTFVSAIGAILFARIIVSSSDTVVRVAASIVLAGAVGNLGDRMLNGHVTDFVLVSFFPFVFNVADAAITVGGVLLAARLLLSEASLDATPEAAPVAETE
jgi:signal peptidase II